MKTSILIVSRNRKAELRKTLNILKMYLKKEKEEMLVFLDACNDGSEDLKNEFPWVRWYASKEICGASKARNILYTKAKGDIYIGFDDDSHPLQKNFTQIAESLFQKNPNAGIIAFKEVKGQFIEDEAIPQEMLLEEEDFYTKDFMGCGFAIRKEVYDKTRGFPRWIDIYGEEICLAMEVLDLGCDILFTHKISVNHRVDLQARRNTGGNYFRFQKQLTNTAYFYLIYYPFPLLLTKIGRLYLLNFKKYAIKDINYFKGWLNALVGVPVKLRTILPHRKPVTRQILSKFNGLANPKY